MSLYNKKKTLALALAVAMVAPAAYAYNVQTNDGTVSDLKPEVVATQVGSAVTMTEIVEINVELGDIIVGRTTGFQLLVTLQDGAEFASAPTLAPGAALAGGWTIALAAGGTPGSTQAQFTFEPTASGSTVSTGILASITGLDLQDVATADGAVTRARFLVRDPVSTATLHDYTPNLIVRDNGLDITCDAEDLPNRIDVGESTFAVEGPKTAFVESPYEIGGASTFTADLGEVEIEATSGLNLAGSDSLTSVLTGDLTAFDRIFLSSDTACVAGGTENDYVINAAGDTATLEATMTDLAFGATGGTASLCVTADGETQIAAQTFNVQNSVTVTAGTEEIEIPGGACAVAPLQYNGSVVDVYHVNPAGNTTAQSFIRVINPSNLDGNVTVVGWDDNGNAAGPITFNLPAGNSKQFNSVDLEEGAVAKGITGSFGNGAGKWRLEVTGEFNGMMVQGLNRNQNDGTITNLTDADNQGEQDLYRVGPNF